MNVMSFVLEEVRHQGCSQDFLKGGAQPSLAGRTISPARRMYCAHITGDVKYF